MTRLLPGPRTAGTCLVLGAVLELVEAAISPLVGDTETHDMAAIASHQERFAVSATLGMAATLLFVPALLGLVDQCSTRRPRLAAVTFWLVLAQLLGYVAVRVTQGMQLSAVRHHLSPDRSAHLLNGVFASPMVLPLGVMFLGVGALGWVLLSITTWLALSRTGGVLLLVFQLADLANFNGGHVGVVVSHVPLLAAAVILAVVLWRLPHAEAHGRTERRAHPVPDRDQPDLVAPAG